MLRSMTGFGSLQQNIEGVEYAVEVRSVNNRYFKSVIKLPEIWSSAEQEIEKLLRAKVYRGTASLSVRMRLPQDRAAYRVNEAALASYVHQIQQVRSPDVQGNSMVRLDLAALLQLPGVCEPPPLEEICRKTQGGLMDLVERAIGKLVQMRDQDGGVLREEFAGHCRLILQKIVEVARRAPTVVREYQARLAAHVAELTGGGEIDIDSEIIAREVAVFADRCDVAEELSRLKSHVEQFLAAMDLPEPSGRKLDFIAQEMLREANTIASKANDASIAQAVVEIKTAIDRIKEQVQNVE